jgi:hypothetical protein
MLTGRGVAVAVGVPIATDETLGKIHDVVSPPLITHTNVGHAIGDQFLHLTYVGVPFIAEIFGSMMAAVGGLSLIWAIASPSPARVLPRLATTGTQGVEDQPQGEESDENPAVAPPEPVNIWEQALQRHNALKDAYAELVCDPLAALEHSALLDVHNERTAAFIDVFGRCQDLRSIYAPDDQQPAEAVVEDYAAAVRKAWRLWDDAVRYAQRVGNDWLPPREQDAARKAAALLRMANEDSATEAERALAARRAHEQLAEITSFVLTDQAVEAITRIQRTELSAHDG